MAFATYASVILALPEVATVGGSRWGFSLSGLVGGVLARNLYDYVGLAGSIVILLALIMVTAIGATNLSFAAILAAVVNTFWTVYDRLMDMYYDFRENRRVKSEREVNRVRRKTASPTAPDLRLLEETMREPAIPPRIVKPQQFQAAPEQTKRINLLQPNMTLPEDRTEGNALDSELEPNFRDAIDMSTYVFPPVDLLDPPPQDEAEISSDELTANAQILEDCLLEFGVKGRVVQISPGPVITRYEVEPAPGVKISRIVSLADDLALAMRAQRIRIVAPIPGKAAVGVEMPNRIPSTVYMREIISSKEFHDAESPLTLALGKTISGEPYTADLDKMPHLLIAGATGAGKSVCINAVIASIIYKAHPTQVQFVMIDPKRLELSIYNNLRSHHLTYREDLSEEVVTSPENAISVLKSVEQMMDMRYEILATAGVRNISEYNKKLTAGTLPKTEHDHPFEPLEYIVLIIDELADLMLTAAREVEEPIARLTQMSRAVGIHLIVATQRPSVDVITGVIKANFPARLAFQVASKIDSRTILDLNGAEKLLGRGDMLFIPPGSPEPIRIHGAFISVEEIEQIIRHVRKQPKYPKHKLPVPKEEEMESMRVGGVGDSNDPLFKEAMKLVVRHQQGSISLLQRRLKVGYARAARLIDELEAAGVVGPFDGSKAREVLMDEMQLEELDES
jgi:S-DNA-T family DNA segregation ATPase FtsK/SpoIIIE